MWKTIKSLLKSRKALMAFVSVAVFAAGKAKWDVDTETMLVLVGPLWMYIFGQGLSDFGKEAKILPEQD